MKRILKYLLIGLIVALAGVLFSDVCGDLLHGMSYGDGAAVGMGAYVCIVLVVCTGVIISHRDNKE